MLKRLWRKTLGFSGEDVDGKAGSAVAEEFVNFIDALVGEVSDFFCEPEVAEGRSGELLADAVSTFGGGDNEHRVQGVGRDHCEVGETEQPGIDGSAVLDLESRINAKFVFPDDVDVFDILYLGVQSGSEGVFEITELKVGRDAALIATWCPYFFASPFSHAEKQVLHSQMV